MSLGGCSRWVLFPPVLDLDRLDAGSLHLPDSSLLELLLAAADGGLGNAIIEGAAPGNGSNGVARGPDLD